MTDKERTLWERFRAIHGPRPCGRNAQAQWEREWDYFRAAETV